MSYPILLRAIVIDSTNKAIRFKEAAATVTLLLAEGTYYLRGDGSADDLLKILKTAIDAAGATNTYTVAVAWSADPSAVAAVITITQAGGATFQFLWADALTTFDPTLLGFARTNTADNTSAKTSTWSPAAAWVADGDYEEFEPIDRRIGYAERARSGKVRRGLTGMTRKDRRISFAFVDASRTHEMFADTVSAVLDVNRCFNVFLDRWCSGQPAELHLVDITSGFTLGALSSTTEQGDRWHVGDEGDADFTPERMSNAVQLYSWSLDLWGHV